MKILREYPDLGRKFELEINLGELEVMKINFEKMWLFNREQRNGSRYYKFYEEVCDLLDNK